MADGNYHVFVGDEVLDIDLFDGGGYLCSSVVAVFFLYLVDVLADDIEQHIFAGKYRLIALDFFDQFGVFFGEFFDLQAGESLELHR